MVLMRGGNLRNLRWAEGMLDLELRLVFTLPGVRQQLVSCCGVRLADTYSRIHHSRGKLLP